MIKALLFKLWIVLVLITILHCPVKAEEPFTVPNIPYFSLSSISTDSQDEIVGDQLDLDRLADSLTQKVLGENRIVDMLDPDKVYTLPLGIVKEIGGMYYTIVLDKLKFTPSGAVLKAYMSVSLPGSTKKFGLVADSVTVGINGIETAQLKMLKDKRLDLFGKELIIKADSTFIEWDCNGYKQAQISGIIYLDEDNFWKENPATRTVYTGQKVAGKFLGLVTDFNDILFSVSLDPFQLRKLKGYSFYAKNIVLDLSDTRNPDGIQFPAGYKSVLFDGENKNLWRGLYISSFSLKFPKTFAKNGKVPEINAAKFLIDLEGISGSLAYNAQILSLDDGNLGGWKFSINSLSLSFEKSEITGFGMSGGIVLPITEPNKPLSYTANIDADNNFLFKVSLPGEINAPLFGSGTKLILDSNSRITVELKDGVYYPKAELHGKMKVTVNGTPGVSLADITFQGLVVQTRQPQIDIKAFSMTSGAMAGFPVQINAIALERNNKDTLLGLKFDASVNLMQEKIAGTSAFVIWAKQQKGEWKYKDIELRKILVDANIGAVDLKGGLENFKNDPTYGNGYIGYVDMSITPGIKVNATAQFGSVSGFRYWFADAGVSLASGIAVFPGFGIYGFGGGAYYHMERIMPNNITLTSDTLSTQPTKPAIGVSKSGIIYKPTTSIALGVMAKVVIGTKPKPEAFNGNVAFGIEFNSSFGINKIFFAGDGRFMTELNKSEADAKVKAKVNIEYLLSKNELSGYAEAYINVANVVSGAGKDNLAGRVDFYFAPKNWFIYIGTPTSPVSLKMGILTAKSYFMVGSVLPDFPPLPSNLASLSSKINFSNLRQGELTKVGGGFAFGASVQARTGEQHFLFFTGNFDMGMGFDFMLKNFGEYARCEGHTGPLGINGWYAQGQAWAWVDAKIGIRVRVFGKRKDFTILDAGFAAVLGAQLPNPTYFAGAVEAKYNVLGGLVKGKCHFDFSYGNQCKLVSVNELEGVSAISELTPNDGANEVDVFTTPQVVFNIPVEEEFEILDASGNKKYFRIKLDYCKLVNGETEIPCAMEWNSARDVLALRPLEVLPSEVKLKLKVGVYFQERGASSSWTDYSLNGKRQTEERMVAFLTGVAPDYITENNVVYTYPLRNMVNFYKNEYGSMYIQLLKGVDYLFSKPGSWRYEAHFKSGNNTSIVPVTYERDKKRVTWYVPDNLVNNSIYSLKIVRVDDSNSAFVADANVTSTEKSVNDDIELTTKDAEGTLSEETNVELYGLHFRTSVYNTFVEKIRSLNTTYTSYSVDDNYTQIHIKYRGISPVYELFDSWEMSMIKIQSVLDQTNWYTKNYKDLIYFKYPLAPGLNITYRETQSIGVPPVYVSRLVGYGELPALNQNVISQGKLTFSSQTINRIENNICYYISNDWGHLRGKAFYLDPNSKNEILTRIKNSSYAGFYSSSSYPITVKYFIPGLENPTSEYSTSIKY